MENPHDYAHNDQFYMMSDPTYSTTSPIFFAYHSFIDLLLENRIQTFTTAENSKAAAAVLYYQQVSAPV